MYDIESAYPQDSNPTMKHLLGGGECEAHLFVRYDRMSDLFDICICVFFYIRFQLFILWPLFDRRIPIENIPCGSDEEVSQWCRQLFVEKVGYTKHTVVDKYQDKYKLAHRIRKRWPMPKAGFPLAGFSAP